MWILTVLDHFTKYLWAEAFKTKDAEPIAVYLYEIFMDNICMPERWHADNGGEFKNFHIDAVRLLLGVNGNCENMLLPYSHSMPRNPQCQGLVERGNRTVKTTCQKLMEEDGFVIADDTTFEWRPYLKKVTRLLNRRIVKMYGFCPCVLMTGQPPEAPDHQSLSPEDLSRLHSHCADQMSKQANGMASKVFGGTFEKGDVVLVHQVAKRSHKDARGKGGRSYTARAVVMRPSKTNSSTHYQLRWLTDGLANKEKKGEISSRMWLAWRLKLAVPNATGIDPIMQAEEQQIVDEVLQAVSEEDEDSEREATNNRTLTDHEAIKEQADK